MQRVLTPTGIMWWLCILSAQLYWDLAHYSLPACLIIVTQHRTTPPAPQQRVNGSSQKGLGKSVTAHDLHLGSKDRLEVVRTQLMNRPVYVGSMRL